MLGERHVQAAVGDDDLAAGVLAPWQSAQPREEKR